MDVDLPQPSVTGVDESVSLACAHDGHLPGMYLTLDLAIIVCGGAFEHDENLDVGMAVQARPFTGPRIHEQDARTDAPMLLPDEVARDDVRGQLVLAKKLNAQPLHHREMT